MGIATKFLAHGPLIAGWIAIGVGAVYGALLGLFFHQPEWLGGYNSFKRRMLRLGHIACFGIGFMNILFALSIPHLIVPEANLIRAADALFFALIGMPLFCILTAFIPKARYGFVFPVVCVIAAVWLITPI